MLHDDLTDRVFFCAPGSWQLHQCRGCGSAYLDPRPTPETIHLAYRTYYTHSTRARVATGDLSVPRRFVRALANGYRNSRYGGDLQPSATSGALVIPLFPRYKQALDREFRYIPRAWDGARILDVGFGSGAFLQLARQVGWDVAGADPDPVAVEAARADALDVRQGGIETFADQAESFDVITLSHVIEHVYDPKTLLKHASQLLKRGGWLYVDTPNIEALGHEEFGEHWRGLEVPRHLTIFSWSALERLVIESGFDVRSRICRTDVYPELAAASRAMKAAKDPYKEGAVTARDRLMGAVLGLRARLNHHHSEFITLMARKST